MDWKDKLDKFIIDFPYKDDIVGVLVSGSYITGGIGKNSDLDVNLVVKTENISQHGKRIIDGLIIDYFLNTACMLESQFQIDIQKNNLLKHTQFATGEIVWDKTGDVAKLQSIAVDMLQQYYDRPIGNCMSERTKHKLWDMLDDLEQIYEAEREDFLFIYFNYLNVLIGAYMDAVKRPYRLKAIYGNITSQVIRDKYLLRELPHGNIGQLISKCIVCDTKKEQMDLYSQLTREILEIFNGFDVAEYTRNS